jgi:aminoglycoside phosphotransferase family enzyme/predicted kinase
MNRNQTNDLKTSLSVVEALLRPGAYPHPTAETIQLVETHISWIFLTGGFAYKLKKPVDLGFLDFSTLEKRRHFCHEELLLNRRLCPDIYLDVLPVVRQSGTFLLGSTGKEPAADYVVRMIQFDRKLELDRLLADNAVSLEQIDQISSIIAGFHSSLPPAARETEYGKPDIIIVPVLENFTHTERILSSPEEVEALEAIRTWTVSEHARLERIFRNRKAKGFIRQCHGDMHAGNMVLWKKRVVIFDCIEFNSRLSVIDVISDIAFLFMDLQHAAKPFLAWRFLNNYLALTGDYEGLRVLKYYCTYRAMVRAKVTAIRYLQENKAGRKPSIMEEHRSYVTLASEYIRPALPMLIITCGVSGSGKSVLSAELARRIGCVHIRSDIERKRLHGLRGEEKSSVIPGKNIYTPEATENTYAVLYGIGSVTLSSGYTIIVDATFLERERRQKFISMSENMGIPWAILHVHAPEQVLAARVVERQSHGGDPSEADLPVLESQLKRLEPLCGKETAASVSVDTSSPYDHDEVIAALLAFGRQYC